MTAPSAPTAGGKWFEVCKASLIHIASAAEGFFKATEARGMEGVELLPFQKHDNQILMIYVNSSGYSLLEIRSIDDLTAQEKKHYDIDAIEEVFGKDTNKMWMVHSNGYTTVYDPRTGRTLNPEDVMHELADRERETAQQKLLEEADLEAELGAYYGEQ